MGSCAHRSEKRRTKPLNQTPNRIPPFLYVSLTHNYTSGISHQYRTHHGGAAVRSEQAEVHRLGAHSSLLQAVQCVDAKHQVRHPAPRVGAKAPAQPQGETPSRGENSIQARFGEVKKRLPVCFGGFGGAQAVRKGRRRRHCNTSWYRYCYTCCSWRCCGSCTASWRRRCGSCTAPCSCTASCSCTAARLTTKTNRPRGANV